MEGARLLLDLRVDKDLWLGTYEPEVSSALRTFCGPGMIAYDLGANVGYTALLLARTVGPDGQVVAFEPGKEIRSDPPLPGPEPEGKRVVLVNAAVGSRSGRPLPAPCPRLRASWPARRPGRIDAGSVTVVYTRSTTT
jgi:FkbM family methyltransferase